MLEAYAKLRAGEVDDVPDDDQAARDAERARAIDDLIVPNL